MGIEVLGESGINKGLGKMKEGSEKISDDTKRRMNDLLNNTNIGKQANNDGRLRVNASKINKTTPESVDFFDTTNVLGVRG